MMNMAEFKDEFISCCRNELICARGRELEIEERTVHKAQRGALTGLSFKSPGASCAPTIYIEDFYRMYRDGIKIGQLSQMAADSVISGLDQAKPFPVDEFDIRKNTDLFRVRLIARSGNEALLEKAPYREFAEDLALVVYMVAGEFRALVTHALLESSGLSGDELFRLATRNSLAAEPAVLYDLTDALYGDPAERINYLKKHRKSLTDARGRPFVLSNDGLFWGASVLFYPNIIHRIHSLLEDDFYVMPSSVHELIILAACGMEPGELREIIRSANRSVVSDDDLLSDELFICESGNIRKVGLTERCPSQTGYLS